MDPLIRQVVDTALFVIANLVNVLMIGIFLSRPWHLQRLERVLGWAVNLLALPVAVGVVLNAIGQREWWSIVLPCLLVAFLVLDLILDYLLRLPFRRTRWLGPFLLLYYLGLMAMIGYSFLVNRTFGFITLGTYFLNLLATWYSYARVGHGEAG